MNCEKNASDIRDLKKKVFGNGRKGLDDRMTIIAGEITIPAGYKWNGCTLAPDFKKTYYASLVHDALYQYKCGRKLADKVFYKMLKEEGFKLAWIYYAGTRIFGWIFY
jgi:hypothetical protein